MTGIATLKSKAKTNGATSKDAALQDKKGKFEKIGWSIKRGFNETWFAEKSFTPGSAPVIDADHASLEELLFSLTDIETEMFVDVVTDAQFERMLDFRIRGWRFKQNINTTWEAEKDLNGSVKLNGFAILSDLFSEIKAAENERGN